MPPRKRIPPNVDGQRLRDMYCLLVRSIREAQSMQSVLQKEQQLRRLQHYLRLAQNM
ncbi:MAG TPA: hypothetical protein VFB21_23145 [Chthonomonadaceae bacterium]|nr:hypothetical protein [Chthonomonadaceae bacterium]